MRTYYIHDLIFRLLVQSALRSIICSRSKLWWKSKASTENQRAVQMIQNDFNVHIKVPIPSNSVSYPFVSILALFFGTLTLRVVQILFYGTEMIPAVSIWIIVHVYFDRFPHIFSMYYLSGSNTVLWKDTTSKRYLLLAHINTFGRHLGDRTRRPVPIDTIRHAG